MTKDEAQQALNRWLEAGGEATIVSVDEAGGTVTFGWSEGGTRWEAVIALDDAHRLFENVGKPH